MGGGGGGKGGETPSSSKALERIATQMNKEVTPLRRDYIQQLEQILRGGTSQAQLPIIQSAMESSRKATSDALRQSESSLASSGLAGTPFGEGILAQTRMSGEAGTAAIPSSLAQQLLNIIPNFSLGTGGTVVSGLQGASQGAIGAQANQVAKDSAQLQAVSGMMPKSPSCCFIFLAAEGGLHPVVRLYRDTHANSRSIRGYCRLADILVPLMSKLPPVKFLTRWLMTVPLTTYGKYYYGFNRTGWIFKPFESFWLRFFSRLGDHPPYTRRGTKEVV